MYVTIVISPETAIAAGHAQSGVFQLEIPDSFVADLNAEERKELTELVLHTTKTATYLAGHALSVAPIENVSLCDLLALIQRQISARHARIAELREINELVHKTFLSKTDEQSLRFNTRWEIEDINASRGYCNPALLCRVDERIEILSATCKRRNDEIEKYEVEKALNGKIQSERLDAYNRANIAAWIAEHGTPSMLERAAERVLPQVELLKAVEDWAFDGLIAFAKYEPLQRDDARHATPEHENHHVEYDQDDADALTENEFEVLKLIRVAGSTLPVPATMQAREHSVWCKLDSCPSIVVFRSCRVTMVWCGHTLTREYAFTSAGADSDSRGASSVGYGHVLFSS